MVSLKTPQEISVMREGGKRLAKVMKELISRVKPRIATEDLDRAAEALILQSGAQPAFKGYEGFPATICTSLNEEIVHVVPSERILKDGDLLTIDIGLIWQGWYLDMARSVPVGNMDEQKTQLLKITEEAFQVGFKEARVGNRVGDIGHAIQTFVERKGYNVVRELAGHFIGRELHEEPPVPNFASGGEPRSPRFRESEAGQGRGQKGTGLELQEGMVFCIEPMVTVGDWHLKKMEDGHGFATKDGSLSCHFEDTIAITSHGPLILTKL